MVNGIADSSQKGRMAASVASLTAAAGLPRLLVDLRHEATHNELPSLAALQLAAHHALTWLRTNYWQKQSDHIDLNKAKISGIIGDYVGSHMAAAIKAAAATHKQDYDSDEDDDDEDNGGGNGGGGTNQKNDISGDYNVAEARKQRQALLTELRVAVPAPATHLIIDGLLQAQITASKESSSSIVVRALTHAIKHLLQEGWNQLPAMLLNTAAVALGKIETSSTTSLVVAPPTFSMLDAADWNIWLEVLAPEGSLPSLPEAAARSIIATSLLSLSEIEQAPLNRWLHQNSVSDEGMATDFDDFEDSRKVAKEESDVARAATLKRLLEVILLFLDDKDLKQRCLAMAARVQDSISNHKNQTAVAAAPQNNSLEIVADLQRLSYDVLNRGKDTSTLKRPRSVVENTHTTEGNIDDKGRENNKQKKKQQQPRFTRCLNWQPCAIGMLPNAVDSNGKIPRLELRAGIQLRDLPKEDVGAGLVTFGGGGGGGGGGGEAIAMTLEEEEQLDGNSNDMTLEEDEDDDDIPGDAEEEEDGVPLPGNAAVTAATGRCPPPPSIRPFI